jgi:hypothetical protein
VGSSQVGQGVRKHVLWILVDADIAELALDGKRSDAVHERPERSGNLAWLLAAQQLRRLAGHPFPQRTTAPKCS